MGFCLLDALLEISAATASGYRPNAARSLWFTPGPRIVSSEQGHELRRGAKCVFGLKSVVRLHTTTLACAMGSLPDDTFCSYCGTNPAGYIPDGAAGALCFWPPDDCCWDVYMHHGWEAVTRIRVRRFAVSLVAPLSKSNRVVFFEGRICFNIGSFLVHV